MIEEEKDNSFRGILRKMFLGETREERISREFESRKLPQEEDSFFKLGRKQEKNKILHAISKQEGFKDFQYHPQKDKMNSLTERYLNKSYYDKNDISRAIKAIEKEIPWKSGSEKIAMKDYVERLKILIK